MKRSAIGAIAASSLLLALVGCSASGGGDGESGELSAEITYALWDQNQVPAYEQIIAEFNEIYPDVKVTIEASPWSQYWPKLQTQASAKTLPDVFWMNGPNAKVYGPSGVLAPITDLIDSGEIDLSNYPAPLVSLYDIDGVQYGVPKDFDTIGVWYNKELLERAGVTEPTSDWTWPDFQAAAKQVSDSLASEGVYGVVAELATGGQQGYYNTIFQAGGEVISEDGTTSGYDSPESIAGLQFWADLIANGSSPTLQQISDTTPNQWFTSGKAAFYWAGSWMVSEIAASDVADVVGTVDMPAGERQATVIHGVANVIAADGDNVEAAKALVAFLASKEAALTQASLGAAIPAFNGTQQAWVDSAPSFGLQMFLDAASNYAVADPESNNTDAWRAVERELLPLAFSGERPVDEVAKELATRMNELLAAE
jgi:multiple sugar transport system substrate-binding protein